MKKALAFFGAFNPPTTAHLELARYALEQTGRETVVFVPSRSAYIREEQGKDYAYSDRARLAMLRAAREKRPWMAVTEYELTLDTALMLKEYLEKCGATVILTRTENDVNISNKERAAIAVKAKPTLFIRLHADKGNTASVKGVKVYIPKSGKLNKTADAKKLGKLVASAAKTTFVGVKATNQYTGLNYATSIRSYQIVLGYLSNAEDDKRLADPENRYEMVAAIAQFCKNFKKK